MFSFSKLSSLENCAYAAYLSYVAHVKEKENSIWGILGGAFHDKLEEIIHGDASTDDLKPLVNNEMEYLDMLNIRFPTTRDGSDIIRTNWIKNMQHFSDTYGEMPLRGDFDTEQLVILKVDDDNYIQGYIDLIRHNSDGSISILDWKTSGMYDKGKFEHAAHQLKLYGLAKEQEGETVKSLSWVFLKYVNVSAMVYKTVKSKNRSLFEKVIERRKIGYELSKYVKRDLKACGYDDTDINIYLTNMIENNTLDGLPEEVKRNYKIELCIIDTEFTQEEKQKTWDWVSNKIKEFADRKSNRDWEPREYGDGFWCNNLCDYRDGCKYLALHKDEHASNDDDDLFG